MRISYLFLSSMGIVGLILASCVPPGTTPETDRTMQSSSSSVADTAMTQPEHILMTDDDVVWADAPASLPAGAKVAVLEGDPSKAGPFTIRLEFPANYTIAPHHHPADEHVTVISGTFSLGMGEAFDEAALEELGEGGFAMMRTGTRHFAYSENGAVIQLHGVGPWGLTYVNSADDPRNQPSTDTP